MKTKKIIPCLLAVATLLSGAACSTANTDATNSTSGSGTASGQTGTNMNSTSAANANAGQSVGSSSTGTNAGATGTTASGGDATDVNAFMGTFATMQDPVFLLTAASSNLLEIQSGQLAAQRATNPEVKSFAQMMVSHHTQATTELQNVARPLGVTMPTALMPVHQAMADQLASKTGKDFDEAYMDLMETAHKLDIAMFEAKSKSAENVTVKGFAVRTLPMLRSHESAANKIEKKVD